MKRYFVGGCVCISICLQAPLPYCLLYCPSGCVARMLPVICKARTETVDGLWTNKMGGEFEEGDPALTAFTFEGRADIKELGGHMRIFFNSINIKRRLFILTDSIKTKLLTDYYEEKKRKKAAAYKEFAIGDESDSDDDDEEEKQRKEQIILEDLVAMEKRKPLAVPKLHLFLTTKKPKTRMVDAHTNGTKVRITGVKDAEGIFGKEGDPMNYEASLTDIPDALGFQGIVVLKLPDSEPITSEPLIYGIVKLQSSRAQKVRTGDALHLTEIAEMLTKIMVNRNVSLDGGAEEAAKKKAEAMQKAKDAKKASEAATEEKVGEPEELVITKAVSDQVKPLHVYRQMANKVWLDYQKPQADEIDFDTFLKFIDHLDIFMVTTQARRIFDAVDLGHDGSMGMSEFENFLIANDIIGGVGLDLAVLDVFDSLKSLPLTVLAKQKEAAEKKKIEDAEAAKKKKLLDSIAADAAKAAVTVPVVDSAASPTKNKDASSGSVNPFADPSKDNVKKPTHIEGLDYSAFCEAVQLLGIKEENDDILREAFCFGASIREKDADKKYLKLTEFRKAWLKLANVEAEMAQRGMKYESGVFADSRNRERLTRALADVEDTYLTNLKKINSIVDHIKQDRRQKKDQKRREQEAHREKLLHEAQKFMAVRSQEKRLKLKREQEERSKKRLEDKVLRNKLQIRQQENQALQRLEISELNKKNEKLRQDEIRALGLDQLDISVQKLRAVPLHLYHTQDAQLKLGYVLYADLSHNILEALPGKDFLYWLSEVRLLRLSENRLKLLPEDVQQLAHLEILELNTNRLELLPECMSVLTSLQRLDLSNNNLETLPSGLGSLRSLRYLKIHSNLMQALPKSIGDCAKLEYFDCSHNKLTELPESMQHLVSLTHLDISANRVAGFPYHIGDCLNLSYINGSTNSLTYIPTSFSALSKLEYCNLENNEIVTTAHCFDNLTSLKCLNLRVNAARVLHGDMGSMRNLTMLDMSVNAITTLPIELGMLRSLQELRLHRNQLVTIPPELGSCAQLQRLEIPYNSLEGCLPDTIGLVTSLVHLDISFNLLDQLPRSIVGLQQLVSINAERCLLTSLPDTFTYLDRLEVLELPNNRFTRFPIELHRMKGLKRLNLANNSLALLPRKIDVMTNLEVLDLSRNQLRALPVEFTDVLECVQVELHQNPWTDLPPRWGKLWPGNHATEGARGYSLPDAVDFLYGMRAIYDTAEQIWEELGVFHYTQKLCLEDFLQEFRNRIPRTWHEGLEEYAKHLYFSSRQTGVFTRWYALDEATAHENELRIAASNRRRDQQVINSRLDLERRQKHLLEVYGDDARRRARHTVERAQEHEKNDEIKQRVVFNYERKNAVANEQLSKMRNAVRERNFDQLQRQEMERLKEIVDADKEGRQQDKLAKKLRNKQPYKLSQLNSYTFS